MTRRCQVMTTTEMQTLVEQLRMVGTAVNPAPIVQLKISFKTVETVSIPGTAISRLVIVQGKQTTEKPCLAGFDLILKTEQLSTATNDRLQKNADIVTLTVITQHQTVDYDIPWSPLSAGLLENVAQFWTVTSGQLEIATKIRRFYDWHEILVAAANSVVLQKMAVTLSAKTSYSENECVVLLQTIITAMQSERAEVGSTAYLVVQHAPTNSAEWITVICQPDGAGTTGHDVVELETISNAQLLAMPVRVAASTAQFWEGLAWLFYRRSLDRMTETTSR